MNTQNTLQTVIDLINKAMVNTQNLQLQPTEHNVLLIAESLKSLRDVAGIVEKVFQENEALRSKESENGKDSDGTGNAGDASNAEPEMNIIELPADDGQNNAKSNEFRPSMDALDGNSPCVQVGEI